MKEFVLDCSATLPWVFASETTSKTDALLDTLAAGGKTWVPALWHLQLANVLLGAQRQRRIDKAGIEQFSPRWTFTTSRWTQGRWPWPGPRPWLSPKTSG
jgi:hypothetical protein